MSNTYTGNLDISPVAYTSQPGQVFPDDRKGTLVEIDNLPSGASVDNIFYFNSLTSGKYLKRVVDAPMSAAYCGIYPTTLDATGDQSSKLATAISAGVTTIVFDSPLAAEYRINSTVTIPENVVLEFKADNALIGSGTINGGTIVADKHQQIFGIDLTVNPQHIGDDEFPVAWYGGLGAPSTDDSLPIQKTIDTVIRNKAYYNRVVFDSKTYTCSKPLILCQYGSGTYSGFTIELCGQSRFWNGTSSGTTIRCTNKDSFCIGVQQGKNVSIRNLMLTGSFTPPALTSDQFYRASYDEFNDPTCRSTMFSPYSGIVIDPFTDTASVIPTDGGYPGTDAYGNPLLSYYHGNGDRGGSTATLVDNCFIRNFGIGVCSSPNGYTQNAEMTTITKVQFGAMRLCLSSGQEQEKGNEMTYCGCWENTHTVFASGLYGAQRPGQWNIHNFNVAGRVNRFMFHRPLGYFPSFVSYVFAESLGTFGTFNSLVTSKVENCEIGFAVLGQESNTIPSNVIESSGVLFLNCNIRYYGRDYPIVIQGSSIYQDCSFEDVPLGGGRFVNCKVYDVPLGPTYTIDDPTNTNSLFNYGKYDINFLTGDNTITKIPIDGSGNDHVIYASLGSHAVVRDVTTNSLFIQLTGAQAIYILVNKPVFYDNGIFGICTNFNPVTLVAQINYIVKGFQDNTWNFYTAHNLKFGVPFIGDVQAGTNVISNLKKDDCQFYGLEKNVGLFVKNKNFATSNYLPWVFVTSYDNTSGPTPFYTVAINSFYTNVGEYFCAGGPKFIEERSANSPLAPNTLIPVNSELILNYNGLSIKYLVKKTGFANASAISDSRQVVFVSKTPLVSYSSGDTNAYVYKGNILEKMVLTAASNTAAINIGTTVGGNELAGPFSLVGGVPYVLDINFFAFSGDQPVYVSGITSQTEMVVYQR